ncbi:MAG: hypothetical protein WHS87_02060 [Anaerolineales bacterium]
MLSVSDTQLLQLDGWTLRLRSPRQQPARLLLMLHGWTGDERSMWVFAPHTVPDYWIVAPRAPFPTQPSGYSWRPLIERRGWPRLEDMQPTAEKLQGLMDALAEHLGVSPSAPVDLMGFSQGAAMTAVFLLLYPERVGKAALLSGFIPQGCEALLSPGRLDGKAIFLAHGRQDEMVPYEWAVQAAEALRVAGAVVTFCDEEVGHKVGAACARDLERFFAVAGNGRRPEQ